MEQLDTYLHSNRLTLAEFAEQVGVGASTVHKWRHGKARPKYHMRRKMSRVTRGAVPVSAWGDCDE